MKMIGVILKTAAAILAIAACGPTTSAADHREVASAPIGTAVPVLSPTLEESRAQMADTGRAVDFEMETLDGEKLRLSELEGSVVILNFWASWCAPCRWEMPLLERMYAEYAGDDLIVVGVAVEDSAESARRFAENAGISYPLGLDSTGEISRNYGVVSLPTTFFIGAGGSVERKLLYLVDEDTLSEFIEVHLNASR